MNGYSVNAYQVFLGYYGGGNPVTIEHQGTLTAGYLFIGGGTTYNLLASDSVANFYVVGGTSTLNSSVSYLGFTGGSVTTAATGTVTGKRGCLRRHAQPRRQLEPEQLRLSDRRRLQRHAEHERLLG